MSAENVELVRSFQPDPDVDVAHLVNDDEAAARLREQIGDCFDPEVECTMYFPGMAPVTYPGGLDGLRRAWRDWLRQWASYRVAIEEIVDGGEERVLVVHRVQGRHRADAPETTLRRGTVWTVRDARVVSVDFNLPYVEALAAMAATAR